MPLMDRIYGKTFLEMSYPERAALIDRVRATRTNALNTAKINSQRITKSALKNITKAEGTKKSKKMLKDPIMLAKKALANLPPEQLAAIMARFK